MTEFTIEIFKADRRLKKGKRFVEDVEIKVIDKAKAEIVADALVAGDKKLSYEIHKTYNEVRNLLSGKIVKEHFRTPYSCSVGSETYFAM